MADEQDKKKKLIRKFDISCIQNLIDHIKFKNVQSSMEKALMAFNYAEKIISGNTWTTAGDLIEFFRKQIRIFKQSFPLETAVTNILRHVLRIIRDEYVAELKIQTTGAESKQKSASEEMTNLPDYKVSLPNLRSRLLGYMMEYKSELNNSSHHICKNALPMINNGDVILTYGHSELVELLLLGAAEFSHFELYIILDSSKYGDDENVIEVPEWAERIQEQTDQIEITLIPDACVFDAMKRATSVIVSAHSVLTDGTVRAQCGVYNIALAAQKSRVPMIYLSHIYKMTSGFDTSMNLMGTPGDILPPDSGLLGTVDVFNPLFDYVPPDLDGILVTQYQPERVSVACRLIKDLYHMDDRDLDD